MADSYNELFGLGSHSPDADLHGWWPLQDVAASTVVVDQLGSNNGTLVGGDNTADLSVAGPNGWLKDALHLDGAADYISLPFIAPGSGSTLLIRAAVDDLGDPAAAIFAVTDASAASFYRIEWFTSSNTIRAQMADGTSIIATSSAISATTFYALSGRFQTNDVTVGVDGTYTNNTGTRAFPPSGLDTMSIGANSILGIGFFQFFDGSVCDASLFDRVMSDGDVDEWDDGPELINSIAPAMTGPEVIGGTLSCTTGTWVLDAPFSGGSNGTATYAYQWTRSNDAGGTGEADISGATSNTYTLVEADKGKFIRCRVRASNDGGFDPAADTNSNMSGAIVAGDIARPKVGASLANRTPLLGGLAA